MNFRTLTIFIGLFFVGIQAPSLAAPGAAGPFASGAFTVPAIQAINPDSTEDAHLAAAGDSSSAGESADAEATAAKESPYEKLFKGKKFEASSGLVDVRKMDGKIYLELPQEFLERYMLLGTVVESTSNANDAAVSERPDDPLPVYFTMADSTIHMRLAEFTSRTTEGGGIESALRKNNIGPILQSFEVEAVTPGDSALVVDATNIFISNNEKMDPFGPYSGVSSLFSQHSSSFKQGRSLLVDAKAYENSLTVTSLLSFGISSSFMGFEVEKDRPATFQVNHTLTLLPEKVMRPRYSDSRIGVSSTEFNRFTSSDDGTKTINYAHRWKLAPKDVEAFGKGELVEPKEPIVFYIDDKFPSRLMPYVREGVEEWNKAFEAAGYKNAIVTKPFPADDEAFSPGNSAYTTVNYIISGRQSAQALSWVDPRSGEILSASVNIYKGVLEKAREDLFVKTGAADPRVRTKEIPDEILGNTLRNITAHKVGHTLGLTSNYGASSAYTVDDLRSPEFTQKNGISPSIMDGNFYNFVAKPGDQERGVKMTPVGLGAYDFYAINWLYKPIVSAKSPEDEVPILKQWISDNIEDPRYRYKKQQAIGITDPHLQNDDLGRDQLKATEYALSNLAYVMNNMNDWIGKEDLDYTFRSNMNFAIINIHFYWYLKHALNNLGGVYQYQKQEGDPFPAYEVVPRRVQKKSVAFLLETLKNLDWLQNAELEAHMNSINAAAPEYMRSVLFRYLIDWGVRKLAFTEQKSFTTPYTQTEFLDDVFTHIWGNVLQGDAPSEEELSMQKTMVDYLVRNSPVKAPGSGGLNSAAFAGQSLAVSLLGQPQGRVHQVSAIMPELSQAERIEGEAGFTSGATEVNSNYDLHDTYFQLLKKSRDLLGASLAEQSGDAKTTYSYFLLKLEKALEIK